MGLQNLSLRDKTCLSVEKFDLIAQQRFPALFEPHEARGHFGQKFYGSLLLYALLPPLLFCC